MNRESLRQKARFIGDGTERECFLLPETPEKCIKIPKPGHGRKQHDHDLKLYKKVAKKPELWEHLARFHGVMKTEHGEGLVFETIRNFDGEVSKSLLDYLYHAPQAINDNMFKALIDLERFVLKHRIILKDPSPSNMLYQKLSSQNGRFILIDGIQLIDLPLPFLQLWARYKAKKQWEKVIMRMLKETASQPDLHRKIQKYFTRKRQI